LIAPFGRRIASGERSSCTLGPDVWEATRRRPVATGTPAPTRETATETGTSVARHRESPTLRSDAPRVAGGISSQPCPHRRSPWLRSRNARGRTVTATAAPMSLPARRRDSPTRGVELAVDDDGRTAAPFASPISRAIPRGATRTTPQDRAASVHARTLGSHERALDRPARFSDRHPGIVERHCSIAHRPSRIADSRAPMSHSHRTSPKPRRLFGTECAGVSRGRSDRAASRAITDL